MRHVEPNEFVFQRARDRLVKENPHLQSRCLG
jgi:hypothetical protein